jgi:hypothetical protein
VAAGVFMVLRAADTARVTARSNSGFLILSARMALNAATLVSKAAYSLVILDMASLLRPVGGRDRITNGQPLRSGVLFGVQNWL